MIVLKKRNLKVLGVDDQELAERLAQALERIAGVKAVEVAVGGVLRIEYDMIKVNLARLEKEFINLGHPASTGRWRRLRRWLARYTEANEHDNLLAPPSPCCSDPRGITDRKQ